MNVPRPAGHRAQLDGVALDLGRRHEGDDLVRAVARAMLVPLTRPRRALRSPSTSPWWPSGTTTVSSETGSSTAAPAFSQRLLAARARRRSGTPCRRSRRSGTCRRSTRRGRRRPGSRARRRWPSSPRRRAARPGCSCWGSSPPTIEFDELGAVAPGHRADAEVGDGVLAVAAGLLLDLALGLGRPGDRLPVRHPDVLGLDVDAELAGQPLEGDGDVGVADAAQHGLAGLLVAVDERAPGPRSRAAAARRTACRRRPGSAA